MADATSMNISLPKPLRKWVDQIVAKAGYGTASEYIRELVRADQRRRARKTQTLEEMLIEGMESGESFEVNDEWWEKKKATWLENARKARES